MPQVSVVIPTRNRAGLVQRAVRCALGQTGVDLEVVVVDDASADGTSTRLRALPDPRVRVVCNENPLGPGGARNRGVAEARGEWIALLDDDDLWSPRKLALQLEAVHLGAADWAYTGFVQVDTGLAIVAGGSPVGPDQLVAEIPYRNVLSAGSSIVLVRKALFADLGGFDPRLSKLEDWDLWIRLASASKPAWVPQPLAAYTEHPGMASLSTVHLLDEARLLDARYANQRAGRPIDYRSLERWMGWCAVRGGRRRDAVGAYVRAARGGDIASLGRAALAFGSPALARRLARRYFDPAWAATADEWLPAARSESAPKPT